MTDEALLEAVHVRAGQRPPVAPADDEGRHGDEQQHQYADGDRPRDLDAGRGRGARRGAAGPRRVSRRPARRRRRDRLADDETNACRGVRSQVPCFAGGPIDRFLVRHVKASSPPRQAVKQRRLVPGLTKVTVAAGSEAIGARATSGTPAA
jgi:hypothetical protein